MPTTDFNIKWDATGEHLYETGVDRGVLYPYDNENSTYGAGVAWNGLTSVSQNPSGAEASDFWADNIKYLNLRSGEDFGATIEAYTYPDEFAECDGSAEVATGVKIGQQTRKMFGFSYRTLIGNDTNGQDHGYKIHLIYGATAAPSERSYSTVNESPEPMTMSWEINTVPVPVTNYKPTAHIEIDSTKCDSTKLGNLEKILYGTPAEGQTAAIDARLPLPAEVISTLS